MSCWWSELKKQKKHVEPAKPNFLISLKINITKYNVLWNWSVTLLGSYWFGSLRFSGVCLCTAFLKSCHSISVSLGSGLWMGHCCSLILSQPLRIADLLWHHCLVAWYNFSWALGVGQMASDLTLATLVHKGVHGLQNRHVSTAVLDSWYAVFAFLYTWCCELRSNITTLLLAVHEHCSTRLVICSDVALKT